MLPPMVVWFSVDLREELDETAGRLLRCFFGDEVPARDQTPVDVVSPVPPHFEGLVPGADWTHGAPKHECRTGDTAGSAVSLVVLEVEAGSSPVLLTDRVNGVSPAERIDVFGAEFRREDLGHGGPRVQHVVDEDIECTSDEALGGSVVRSARWRAALTESPGGR
jgi:hypothetical protein